MTEYLSDQAVSELADIGYKILSKTDLDLKKKKVYDVARVYALVRRESEKIETEARRMRLEGVLDENVYKELSKGYVQLSNEAANSTDKGLLRLIILHARLAT